ncbi:unnamed protein product [Nesidiocoris tenuis]|uniref:Uncharacterized protein n=1 Tax=Nesidiocoris tenuis TaxID=355587 RepID=A0A6H5HL27_9HEMI|nr:unnamed protein product [Nesidiocoris tenuis]
MPRKERPDLAPSANYRITVQPATGQFPVKARTFGSSLNLWPVKRNTSDRRRIWC